MPRQEESHADRIGDGYARYALAVLVLVYVFNFLDRQLPAILAERIKPDLQVGDAQLGYLYGTAFAVFYALFGIPLGRLADAWDRPRLIAIGLGLWSLMTAASGRAGSFAWLALARVGVGVGEASATPAAYSLLSDYFPARRRATVLAIYSSGIYLGSGLGIALGGLIVERWGWRAAFLAAGLPGLLLAAWVGTLREPRRGMTGMPGAPEPRPWSAFLAELRSVVPPFTLLQLRWLGASRRALAANVALGALLAVGAAVLTLALGTPGQWWSLALGLYAAGAWGQALRLRDPPSAALIFDTPSLRSACLGFAWLSFSGYGLTFWIPTFFARFHEMPLDRVGLVVGGAAAAGGWLGVTLGGLLADRWRRTSPFGRLRVGLLNAVLPVPLALAMLWVDGTALALALSAALHAAMALWLGPGASTVQDLVLPRMRALASAAFLMAITLVGLALGPYAMGRLSEATDDLRVAMSFGLLANLVAASFFASAMRTLERDEASVLARARSAGEVRS
ncbi:MAG TPA: MFS transporter [Vicinamibacteria bacterium]|nr:MFS transporter [Vicinamibacteria bacterium]